MMYKPLPKRMTRNERREKYPLPIAPNFYLWEVVCPCCGFFILDGRFLQKMQLLRARVGRAVNVTSWYRCNHHNRAVEGAENSWHQWGLAADIFVHGMSMSLLASHARAVGLHVIIYAGHVHVDDR